MQTLRNQLLAATLGKVPDVTYAVTAVFQYGWGANLLDFTVTGGIVQWLPLFMFVILFGLSMDYHVFIISRIREAYDRGLNTQDAVEHGSKTTAGVVTSAAVVLVGAFAIFATLPILDMKEMGVGLAAAVLIDATIVRAVLLPATMKLLGDWNWYLPRWLNWLPKLGMTKDAAPEAAQHESSLALSGSRGLLGEIAPWRVAADTVSMACMAVTVVRYSERPELWQQIAHLSDEAWPEYNVHGEVLGRYWPLLYKRFADYQFVLYDDERDEVLAEGQTVPCAWDGTLDGLGPGIDDMMTKAFALHDSGGRPDTLCALAAKIPRQHQDKRLAAVVLTGMADTARQSGLRSLIAPVRPNWKDRYPITPIERYVRWTREDGSAFDPWIRVHLRLGATLGPALPRSMRIAGRVAEWEAWTGMRFPESGDYVFPAGLASLHVDTERDLGEYWEPNVWLVHPVRT